MRLENIGFYTLSDARARNSSIASPLWRCELILTNRCNFRCPYCRGLQNGHDITLIDATNILNLWIDDGLKNVRFSGGEPTLYKELPTLIGIAKYGGVERIAVSTNGSASSDLYECLVRCGVNDFSVSLDACCSSTGDIMSGKKGAWDSVVENIKLLSSLTYTTVGIVVDDKNKDEVASIIEFAHSLGVSDIRVIPSAQYNMKLELVIPTDVARVHPILKYRLTSSRHVRGLSENDCGKCRLVLDDMAIWDGHHYPCIIYLRENGKPIGRVGKNMRWERLNWYEHHFSFDDRICRANCLDVCIEHNNKAAQR